MDNRVVCKYCGEVIDPDAGFCPVCGAVNKMAFRQDPNKMYCKFCGAELTGTEGFCLVCGTPVRRVIAGGSDGKHSSIDNIVPELKKKQESDTSGADNIQASDVLKDGDSSTSKEGEPLNFLQKAARKQQQDAAREEELEKRRIEETKVFNEEKQKLRVSATQVSQPTAIVAAKAGSSQTSAIVTAKGGSSQPTKRFDGGQLESEPDSDLERLKSEAAEAGVSVEEMKLFEQVKARFETENETYPDDYNVNDYAQFDYAESRYGSYNLGSLELERIEYQNQEKQAEESAPPVRIESRKESSDQGAIGTKTRKTPLVLRILFFFIAIFAVAGLAGIILYVVPAMKQVHPTEILMDESVETVELTITPLVAATSTPTPTLTPTPTMTPTPTVNAIVPQSITPAQTEDMEEIYVEYEEEPETTEPSAMDIETIETPDSGYLVSDSDYRLMDPSELDGRSADEIRLIANEIYARYGYSFQNEVYSDYFGQFDWYNPVYDPGDFPDEILSDVAQENLNMIAEYEAQHGI